MIVARLLLVTFLLVSFDTVVCQFPPNGDPAAILKMKSAIVFEKAKTIREAEKTDGLQKRAIHSMKALEKFSRNQEFLERGSLKTSTGEVLPQNKNINEQVIDPRTPTGFGNPFFTEVRKENKIQLASLLSVAEIKGIRDSGLTMVPELKLGWIQVEGGGSLDSADKMRPEFSALLAVSPNKIIRRQCEDCLATHRDIYYKRLTTLTSRGIDLLNMFVGNNYGFHESDCGSDTTIQCKISNVCDVDFTLHSAYDDAVNNTNKWEYCNTVDYGSGTSMYDTTNTIGFPGYSGPIEPSDNQYIHFNELDGQSSYALFIEQSNWIPITGSGWLDMAGSRAGQDIEEYNILERSSYLLYQSANKIIRRICLDCTGEFQDIYYKRLTVVDETKLNLWNALLRDFKEQGSNKFGKDFNLFSSYEDALNDRNAWEVCESDSTFMGGLPGLCRPYAKVEAPENQWIRYGDGTDKSISTREAGAAHIAFYIEDAAEPETEAWMTEDDEMKAFLYPQSTLDKDDDFICKVSDVDYSNVPDMADNLFTTALKPYLLLGRTDPYAGFYDLQGKGRCGDWCGWFSSDTMFDGGMNPIYQSWTAGNDMFACLTDDERWSGANLNALSYDITVSNAFVPPEMNIHNKLFWAAWVQFAPPMEKCDDVDSVTLNNQINYRYVGCYNDAGERALPYLAGWQAHTPDQCHDSCRSQGFHYFGIQMYGECWCGGSSPADTSYARHGLTTLPPNDAAYTQVYGDQYVPQTCGPCDGSGVIGPWRNCVFQVLYDGNQSRVPPSSSYQSISELITMPDISQFPPNELPYFYQVPEPVSESVLPQCVNVENYDAGWGPCETYAVDSYNHYWCPYDVDANGIIAKDACSECGVCVDEGDESLSTSVTASSEIFFFGFEDEYAGYYDVQRCGECNDFCFWIGPTLDGLGVDPRFKAYTQTDYFTCILAGGYSDNYGVTERGYFGVGFRYQKCEGKGAPTPDYRKEKYLGCFWDDSKNRALPEPVGENYPSMTLYQCAESCRLKGYHYYGRQYYGECWCGGESALDTSYAMYGEISIESEDYCGACDSNFVGGNKNCVFQILDQFDPEVERKKHVCSHIPYTDLRRYCYVACRDSAKLFSNLLTCKALSVQGQQFLNKEIAAWYDSPSCDRKDCSKKHHPLNTAKEVKQSNGTF